MKNSPKSQNDNEAKDEVKALTARQIASLPAEAATEKMPDFSQDNHAEEKELLLKLDPEKEPILYQKDECCKATINKQDNLYRINLKCADKKQHLFGETAERIEAATLRELASQAIEHVQHRPKWMEMHYTPKTLNHVNERLLKNAKCGQNLPLSIVTRGELLNFNTYPWCTIGKVFVGEGNNFDNPLWVGSGVLVGRNLMLTASHAAPWGRSPWWMRFVPAYNNGNEPFGRSYVQHYRGVRNTDDVTGLDYVICKLYTPLGDRVGWMGSQSYGNDDNYYNGSWTSVGYPTDFAGGQVPAVENNLRIEDVDNDSDGRELETRVFSTGGWSGGPLWGWIGGQPKVIGIMSGNEEEFSFWDFFTATHSVSAGGSHMVDLVKYGIANWPV